MRRQAAILAVASVVAVGTAASALYAQDSRHDGMMSRSGMMGMMGRMGPMSQVMNHCSQMMSGNAHGGGRPNDRWRKPAPATPRSNG